MAARAALPEAGGFVAIILTPVISLLRAIDHTPCSMTATSFLPWTARESETFLTLRTGYKVLRAAIAYISRSQGEDDEFKSV
jgi:hypothetical protein